MNSTERAALLESLAAQTAAPLAIILTFVYFALVPAHLFVLAGTESLPVMVAMAAGTGVVCAFLYRNANRRWIRINPHAVIAVMTVLMLVNVLVHMLLYRDVLQTTNLAIIVTGIGFLIVSRPLFVLVLGLYWLAWWFARAALPPHPDAVHYQFMMLMATLIAITAHVTRVRTAVSSETDRLKAAADREQLLLAMQETRHNEVLGQLAGGIAHDVNNMLLIARGNIELAQDGSGADENLAAAEDALSRCAGMIRQILAYSGRDTGPIEYFDLRKDIADTVELFKTLAPGHVEIAMRLEDGPIHIVMDRNIVQRVMLNLLKNSVEALGTRSGTVCVALQSLDSLPDGLNFALEPAVGTSGLPFAQIDVSDDGPGIDNSIRRNMFDPFVSSKGIGRGLGLAAVMGSLRKQGAGLAVGDTPGDGACFTVVLPLRADDAIAARRPPAAGDAVTRSERSLQIVVVDDETLITDVLEQTLSNAGHHVTVFNDSIAAADHLNNGADCDLIVLDVAMPQLDGLRLLQRMRKDRHGLPAVFVSGFDPTREIESIIRDDPGVRFLAKPFRMEALHTQILDLTAGRRS